MVQYQGLLDKFAVLIASLKTSTAHFEGIFKHIRNTQRLLVSSLSSFKINLTSVSLLLKVKQSLEGSPPLKLNF